MFKIVKNFSIYPRYCIRKLKCKFNFIKYGDRYNQKVLFIAGLPKSGTTWLENIICSFPGFSKILIPEVTKFGMRTGGSHNYELPDDMFSRFKNMLVLTKMHVWGSENNARILKDAGVNYVIMYRDLRDVAISHYYYVRNTPWHPEYPVYSKLSLHEGLKHFADTLLLEFAEWVRLWYKNRDPEKSLVVRYEDMLKYNSGILKKVIEHFELAKDDRMISETIEKNSFKNLSKGRIQGQVNNKSFFRQGKAGGWKKDFTPELKKIYKEKIGAFLIEFDYEKDLLW